MKRNLLCLVLICLFFYSCTDKSTERYLRSRIATLEYEIEECKNGPSKLYSKAKMAYEKGDYATVKALHSQIESRYPDAVEFTDSKKLYDESVSIQAKKTAETKAIQLQALNKLKKEVDDVAGTTWYYQHYFTHYSNSNKTSIYMGKAKSLPWLCLKMSYTGDDWIFFDKAYLSYEGNTIQVLFDDYRDKESDNGSGGVWEWINVPINHEIEVFLREFAKSKDAKMRLTGKYSKTRNLTFNERQGILDVLNGYDALISQHQLNASEETYP